MSLLTISPTSPNVQTTTVAVFHYRLRRGECFGLHAHDLHQLTWSPTGTLVAETPGAHWQLPCNVALWVPGGVEHDIGVDGDASVLIVKFNPRLCPNPCDAPAAVAVGDVLAALVRRLADPSLVGARRRRMESVVFDEIVPLNPTAYELPLPSDERALIIARHLIADPADGRTLAEWGSAVGAGERTLVRLFAEQTGLTFTAWRAQLRIASSLELLDRGCSTTDAARRVGYRDVGAFIEMFRRTTGTTPGSYGRQRRSRTQRLS